MQFVEYKRNSDVRSLLKLSVYFIPIDFIWMSIQSVIVQLDGTKEEQIGKQVLGKLVVLRLVKWFIIIIELSIMYHVLVWKISTKLIMEEMKMSVLYLYDV